jgi:hypothetical protein
MNVSELIQHLNLRIYGGGSNTGRTITGGYTSDLLSDVIGNADEGNVWITLQTHKNVMAVASLKDVAAVVIVKGNMPEEGTIQQSNIEGIPLLGTDMETFEITGLVYKLINNC